MNPYVIGIAGGSASGKSTFTEQLAKRFADMKTDATVFHMDSYFKPPEQLPTAAAPITGIVYKDHNHPLTADLPKLAADLAAAICGEDTAEVPTINSNHRIIIVEGLLTLWDDAIYRQLDLKLFIDCRPDERIVRRLRRNMQWGLAFDEIAAVYLDLVRYRHDEYVEPSKWRADLVINGSNPSELALDMVVNHVIRGTVQIF